MGDLFDIANLITTVGVDAVKIKPEPGLPEKSSNEILTELFSTFDVPDGDDDDDDDNEDSESGSSKTGEQSKDKTKDDDAEAKKAENENDKIKVGDVKVKKEKLHGDEAGVAKKKKAKKKHKHKSEDKDKEKHKHKGEEKDKEKKHKHKKKSKHNSSESASDAENGDSKKKKKKKKSKRKHESDDAKTENGEPSAKVKKLEKSSKDKSKDGSHTKDKTKLDNLGKVKIKKEKEDANDTEKLSELKEASSVLRPISKILDDDAEAVEVPKLLEKSKTSISCKILIKDLKNSEVYNNAVKEVENQKKEKAERMEDGEITDSDDDNNDVREDNNRTPTLSPTPPPNRGSLHSDRIRYSPSPPRHISKKTDLRLMLKEKEKKKKQQTESRSRSKSSRKDGRSKDRHDDRSRSCHSRDRRTRSRSGDRSRHARGRSRDRRDRRRSSDRDRHGRDGDKHKSRSEDRSKNNKWRGRSRSRERKERIEIDKKKLLEIARRNAINMIMKGKLPLAQQDKAIAAIQAGGKTIEELTDFCKSISKSEAMGELSSISSDDDSESEKGFHHPFLIKERPSSIIMNIRDAKQLPTKTLLEKTAEATNQLRLQFPVSSGQQHRKNESEWIPVVPAKPSKHPKHEPKKLFIPAKEILHQAPLPLVVPPLAMQVQAQPVHPVGSVAPYQTIPPIQPVIPYQPNVQVPQQVVPVASVEPIQQTPQESIFPVPPAETVDISTIVSQRLAAMRKLSENPNDIQALKEMNKAQSGMKSWIESKQIPGQFTGSTGAKVLTPAELNSGHQAWARKDQLLTAQPLSGGMGMLLLQKMGWTPGEGLGKNKEGTLEPLQLEVKLDKRGLVSDQDVGAAKLGKVPKSAVPAVKTLEGKHPVSLLGEYCSKRKFGAPVYELCFECGPDHKKNFLFKVKVNGTEYKPAVASPNKKLAKAEAAQVCLQSIGLLP